MWIHMHGASMQVRADRDELKNTSKEFMLRYDEVNSWRYEGRNRFFYYPVTRLMTYFMGLVALAWLLLALNSLGSGFGVNFPLQRFPFLFALSVDALVLALIMAIIRRVDDIREHRDDVIRKQKRKKAVE